VILHPPGTGAPPLAGGGAKESFLDSISLACPKWRMRTILLVEDDEDFRHAAARHLSDAGLEVLAVPSTMTALIKVNSGRRIDAFVIDIVMPPGAPQGPSFGLMMHRRRPAAPMLFITSFPRLAIGELLPGKILSKPITLDKLTSEVQALFPAPHRAEGFPL